jgi:hypothetical protein
MRIQRDKMTRESAVSEVSGYRLDKLGSILSKNGELSLLHHVQIGPGAHPVSYPMTSGDKSAGSWS